MQNFVNKHKNFALNCKNVAKITKYWGICINFVEKTDNFCKDFGSFVYMQIILCLITKIL